METTIGFIFSMILGFLFGSLILLALLWVWFGVRVSKLLYGMWSYRLWGNEREDDGGLADYATLSVMAGLFGVMFMQAGLIGFLTEPAAGLSEFYSWLAFCLFFGSIAWFVVIDGREFVDLSPRGLAIFLGASVLLGVFYILVYSTKTEIEYQFSTLLSVTMGVLIPFNAWQLARRLDRPEPREKEPAVDVGVHDRPPNKEEAAPSAAFSFHGDNPHATAAILCHHATPRHLAAAKFPRLISLCQRPSRALPSQGDNKFSQLIKQGRQKPRQQ